MIKLHGAHHVLWAAVILLFLSGCTGPDARKGTWCLEIGDYERAIWFFEKVLQKNPRDRQAHHGLARAWVQKCTDMSAPDTSIRSGWRAAIYNFNCACKVNGSLPLNDERSHAYLQYAKSLGSHGDTSGARSAAHKALLLDSTNIRLLNYSAILAFRSGDHECAGKLLEQARVADSTDATAVFNLGMLAWKDNDFFKAHHHWLKALKISPRDTSIQYWFAKADLKLSVAGKKK